MPEDLSPISPKKRNIGEIYGDGFLSKLLKGVKMKKSGDGGFKSNMERIIGDQ
jgi:hypothetical protein